MKPKEHRLRLYGLDNAEPEAGKQPIIHHLPVIGEAMKPFSSRPGSAFLPAEPNSSSIRRMIGFLFLALLFTASVQAGSGERVGPSCLKAEAFVWLGPGNHPLPFRSSLGIEEFLRSAEVISMEVIPTGITRPMKVTLEKDGIRMKAVFRNVDRYRRKWKTKNGLKMNFYDRYIFECAAYELGKLLGVTNIPPVVLRTINGEKGSLQAWLENSFTEGHRIREKIAPPDARKWLYQVQQMRVFDNLIYNDDRNQGNILIDEDWNLWMIDETRAFRTIPDLRDPENIHYCERNFWQRLVDVDENLLKETLQDSGLLGPGEMRTLLKRREKLIHHIKGLIEVRGEKSVLVEL